MSIGENIRQLRLSREMSQEDVAKVLNTTKQTIYKYESGIVTNIPLDKIEILARLFGVTPAYLMGWNDNNETQVAYKKRQKGFRIPVLGVVAGGTPVFTVQDLTDEDPDTWEEIPESMACSGDYVALRVKGASMEPQIFDGDIVIIRVQPDIDSGQIAIVLVNGDEGTCKQVLKSPNGITLVGFNTAVYSPTFYTNKEIQSLPIRIFGRVIEVRRKF